MSKPIQGLTLPISLGELGIAFSTIVIKFNNVVFLWHFGSVVYLFTPAEW